MGCGPGGAAPILETVDDATAYPGQELRLELHARDHDSDDLRFTYNVRDDLEGIYDRSSIRTYADGSAVFHYTPVTDDVGEHPFEFVVTDGDGLFDEAVVWIAVETGGTNAPVFREPIGAGTAFDVSQEDCLVLNVVVEDTDTPEVELSIEPPAIAGAQLRQTAGHAGLFTWCPSEAQATAQGNWMLNLGATDDVNPTTIKSFLILLR